jgi:mono/diheme cytochrome c family protein
MKPWLLLLAMPVVAFACSDDESTTTSAGGRIDTILALTGDADEGELEFPSTCGLGASPCHEEDGTQGSGIAADLTEVTAGLTDRQIVETVINGKGQMLALATSVEDQQVADIVAYMRREWGQ